MRLLLAGMFCMLATAAFAQGRGGGGTGTLQALQLDTLTGLGAATIPQFLYRTGAGAYGGSFLGTSQDQYNQWPGQIEISNGTSGAGDTTAGAVLKVSRTSGPPLASCTNQTDMECSAGLVVSVLGLPGETVLTSGIYGSAQTSATGVGQDAIGMTGSGRVTGSGDGLGTGAYIEGRRDTATAGALGTEIRAMNITASNCSYNTTGIGGCDGVWLTSSGDGVHTTALSSALHVGNADALAKWAAGLTINTLGATVYGIDDESAATNGFYENGTHTYAILTGTAAGKTGLGTLTPTAPLEVAGPIRSDADSYCTAAKTFTSNVTLAPCTGMTTGTLAGGKTYAFQLRAYVTAADAAGGVQVDLNGGNATATTLIAQTKIYNGTTLAASTQVAALATAVGFTAVVTDITIDGTIVVNGGGTLIPRFAQNASDGTPTTIGVGSSLTIRQLN